MRILIFALLFISFKGITQPSIYSYTVNTQNAGNISLASHKGKKLIIVSVTPGELVTGKLQILDTLAVSYPGVVIIALIAEDIDASATTKNLDQVKLYATNNFFIVPPVQVKKDKGISQYSLMKWLTSSNENMHFDNEVQKNIQFYFINEKGDLYAVVEDYPDPTLFKDLLK